jgi:alkylation response protein AidB-like acyl-CoA dehydrogenase
VGSSAITLARELSPLIKRLRDETEGNRRIAAPIVERLRETGLCRIAIPRELKGLDLPLLEALDVYEVLAAAEASVAWVVWNNALPCLFGRFLDAATRASVFGDPTWLYASSTRPTGRAAIAGDGYRISGRWSLVSGCELAEWIALMCVVEENGEPRMIEPGAPELRIAFVRRGDYEILDTWYVGGLRGTGSHDVVVRDAHVALERAVTPGTGSRLDAPIERMPIIATMAAGYASQMVGMARAAIDSLAALTSTKVTADPGPGLRDRPTVLVAIAGKLWDVANAGGGATIDDITAVWTAARHAVDTARHATEAMYDAGGTSSLYAECPLERAHRDMHAMLRHIIAQDFWLEDAGRVKLGMSPTHPLYAL